MGWIDLTMGPTWKKMLSSLTLKLNRTKIELALRKSKSTFHVSSMSCFFRVSEIDFSRFEHELFLSR